MDDQESAPGQRGVKRAAYVLLAVALTAGLYGRFAGLGERQLAVDEFFFSESVGYILDRGVPSFEDGGFYVQGLLPQYVTAASVRTFGRTNFALRLPAVLFGLFAVLLAYRYARLHLSVAASLMVSAALLASSWEIEFSRFARMYTALQWATLGFLYRYERSLVGSEWRLRYHAHVWAVVAVLCHLEGAILAPLLFAPLLAWNDRKRFADAAAVARYGIVSAAVAAGIGFAAAFDFRRWGVEAPFPNGYEAPETASLRLPEFALWNPGADGQVLLGVVLGTIAIASLTAFLLRRAGLLSAPEAGLPLLLAAALVHQWAAAGLIAFALALRYGARHVFWSSGKARALTGATALVSCGWLAIAAMRSGDWVTQSGAASWAGALRRTFVSWPDWIEPLGRPWSEDLPILGVLIPLSAGIAITRQAGGSWIALARGPAAALCYGIAALGVLRYFYEFTRYSFLFYPAALMTLALAARRLADEFRGAIVFAAAFALSGDFDPRHIAAADGEEVSYRMGRFEGKGQLWYPRRDYAGIAAFLNSTARAEPEGLIVVYDGPPAAPLVESHDYYSYVPRESYVFYQRSRARGTRELWIGRKLISTPEELRDVSRFHATVRLADFPEAMNLEAVWGERLGDVRTEFVSRDGRLDVRRVQLTPPTALASGVHGRQNEP